jgi:hypothetical protein
MPTNEMLDTYIYRDKTFVDKLWINPENIKIPHLNHKLDIIVWIHMQSSE